MDALRKNKTNLIFLFGLEEQRFVSIYQEYFKFINSSMDTVLSLSCLMTRQERKRQEMIRKERGKDFAPSYLLSLRYVHNMPSLDHHTPNRYHHHNPPQHISRSTHAPSPNPANRLRAPGR